MKLFIDPTYDDMWHYLSRLPIISNPQEKDAAIYFFCRLAQNSNAECKQELSNINRALHRIKYVPAAEDSEPKSLTGQNLLQCLIHHYTVFSC